jgi:hypothetical protein
MLFKEKWRVCILALIPQCSRPIKIEWTKARSAFTAADDPLQLIDPGRKVQRAEQRLA